MKRNVVISLILVFIILGGMMVEVPDDRVQKGHDPYNLWEFIYAEVLDPDNGIFADHIEK